MEQYIGYKGEDLRVVAEEFKSEEFELSQSGRKNVSYRLWNLWDKSCQGKSNLRVIVR